MEKFNISFNVSFILPNNLTQMSKFLFNKNWNFSKNEESVKRRRLQKRVLKVFVKFNRFHCYVYIYIYIYIYI